MSSFAFLTGTAQALLAQVIYRDRLADRPQQLRAAVIGRLASGVRLLASFVRRLLVLMALSMEHDLLDKIDPAAMPPRPDGKVRAMKKANRVDFRILEPPLTHIETVPEAIDPFNRADWRAQVPSFTQRPPPTPQKLYRLLDLLATMVADPESRARRLAWWLARTRRGPLLPPAGPHRIAGHWGTEVRASHEAMANAITLASRERPPPLAPPRRRLPTVTRI